MAANQSLDSTGFCAWVLPLSFSVLMVSPPVSQLTLSDMKAVRVRSVKNVCWLLFIVICVFHAWFDGRNGTLMHALEGQGQSLDTAREQLRWLCAPLNIATLTVLVLIVALSVKWKRSG